MGYQGWTLDGDEAESNPTIGPPKKKERKKQVTFSNSYYVEVFCYGVLLMFWEV